MLRWWLLNAHYRLGWPDMTLVETFETVLLSGTNNFFRIFTTRSGRVCLKLAPTKRTMFSEGARGRKIEKDLKNDEKSLHHKQNTFYLAPDTQTKCLFRVERKACAVLNEFQWFVWHLSQMNIIEILIYKPFLTLTWVCDSLEDLRPQLTKVKAFRSLPFCLSPRI